MLKRGMAVEAGFISRIACHKGRGTFILLAAHRCLIRPSMLAEDQSSIMPVTTSVTISSQ